MSQSVRFAVYQYLDGEQVGECTLTSEQCDAICFHPDTDSHIGTVPLYAVPGVVLLPEYRNMMPGNHVYLEPDQDARDRALMAYVLS